MIAWSTSKLKLTSGIGALCTAAMMADLSHQQMPFWLVLLIAILPLTIFFVRPDGMRPSIARPLQTFACAWYFLTLVVLAALFFRQSARPNGWQIFFIGGAIGCIPCVVVLKNLFTAVNESSPFRAEPSSSGLNPEPSKDTIAENYLTLNLTGICKPSNARLELKVNKSRLVKLLGMTCALVSMCFFCTTLPDITPRIVGWAGVCFFSLGFAVLLKQLVKSGPQFVIDGRGIEERRSNLGLIEWADIESLAIVELHSQKFLSVQVRDLKKYLDRIGDAGKIASQANRAMGFSEITIGFDGLSHSTDEVMGFIRENFEVAAN
jgi:hypothetical protein